jgi:hypothetical protein
MPNLLTPENARFLSAPQPVLLVALPAETPPLPALAHDESGAPAHIPGWSVLAGVTLCVVDGPGEQGFLLPTISDANQMEATMAWAASVTDCGGAYVLQVPAEHLDAPLAHLMKDPATRGGFVESVR